MNMKEVNINVRLHSHTHTRDNRQQKHTTQKLTIHNNIQAEYIFNSYVNIDSMSYMKILRFMGDILAVRENIFKRMKSMSNKISLKCNLKILFIVL